MHKLLCSSIAAVAAMIVPAVAADLSVAPMYNVPSTPGETWSGSYSALTGNGGWGRALDSTTAIAGPSGFDLGGGPVGMTSGLNFQKGKWVVGYESDVSVTKPNNGIEIAPNIAWSGETKERWLSTYRGRIGIAQDNWLFYATAGGALANIQQSALSPMGQSSDAGWYWGWSAGAGVEWKVGSDWSAKVEYLYVGLQDKSYFNPAPTAFQNDQRMRTDDHTVRVGVNYKLPWNVLDSFFSAKR
jgi:outer membrane immunogenic protein